MTSMIGVQPDLPSSTKKAGLLDRFTDTAGAEFVYVQAEGAITGAGYVVLIDEAGQADMIETTISATARGQMVGVAQAAFADDDYGWVQIFGTTNIRVAASAAANAVLNTTATGGQIDDDATTGAEVIDRMVLTTARGGSAGTAEGVLFYPTVGATL